MARGQRRLGAVPRPLLGHAAADLALRRVRPRHLHRLGRRARRAGRARPRRPRPAPPLRRRRHLRRARRRLRGTGPPARAGARRLVRLGLDAVGPAPLPVRGRGRRSTRPSRPTSSARPSTRPAAGSTRCSPSTRSCSTRRLPQRRVPRPHRRRGRARRCRSPRATSSTPGTSSPPTAPTRCAGTSSPPASRGRRGGCSRTASASPPARPCSRCGTCSRFFATYADLDGWTPDRRRTPPRRPTCSTAGSSAELDDTVAAVTDALEGFDALGGATRLGRVRRRPLQLVRAPQSRPRFWKAATRRPTPPSTSAWSPRPSCSPRSARSWPTSSTPRLTGGRSVHLADWPEPTGRRDADAGRARWPPPAGWSRSAGRPAPTPRSKVRQPLRRALLLHPGIDARPTALEPRSPTELNVKALERHRHALGPHDLDRRAQLPRARPPPRAPRSTR